MLNQDLRSAVRTHARRPLATAAAVATLALGLGASCAIFSVAHGILKPLPYPRSAELVRVHHTYEHLKTSTNARLRAIWNRIPASYLNTLEWRRQSRHLTTIGLYADWTATWTGAGEPVEVVAARVDAELLTVLAVEPVLGRLFQRQEFEDNPRTVLLSHGFWRQSFGGDASVLDQSLRLDGELYSVLGVMPPGFRVADGRGQRLWAPLQFTRRDQQDHGETSYSAVARLAPGSSLGQAREELAGITARLVEAFPEENAELGVHLTPLLDHVVGDNRTLLLLLLGAVAIVLLIACVNVAHLLLARTMERRHELAVRAALGASRWRLARQLLVESLLLALAGGVGGLLIAASSRQALLARIPADLPRTEDIRIDGGVLLFTLAMSLMAMLAAGLLPALFGCGASPEDLKASSRAPSPRSRTADNLFVVAEIALTLVLTAGAGLLVASFVRLAAVDPGFDTEDVLVQQIQLPEWRYADHEKRLAFADRLIGRLVALPGVRQAALTTKLPLPGPSLVTGFRLPGRDTVEKDWTQGRNAALKAVTPGYFAAMGIPLLAGRVFDTTDRADSLRVVVINRTLAEAHLLAQEGLAQEGLAQDGVGQTLIRGLGEGETYRVVGIVDDVHQEGIDTAPREMIYEPWAQALPQHLQPTFFAVLAMSSKAMSDEAEASEPGRLLGRALHEHDPMLALSPAVPLKEMLYRTVSVPRYRTTLVGLFAVLALILTLVGVYAVMSTAVSRGEREIGIRMALGASTHGVRRWVLGQTLKLTTLGIILGVLAALAAARLLRGLLYGIQATDPWTLSGAALLVALTSMVAGYLPAHRASRIDPAGCLRGD